MEEGGRSRGQRTKLQMKVTVADKAANKGSNNRQSKRNNGRRQSDRRRVSLQVCLTRLGVGFGGVLRQGTLVSSIELNCSFNRTKLKPRSNFHLDTRSRSPTLGSIEWPSDVSSKCFTRHLGFASPERLSERSSTQGRA